MRNDKKAEVTSFGLSKTNLTGSETISFSCTDSSTDLEQIGSIIAGMMRSGKTIRLYRCFACHRNRSVSRMSTCLVVCRECSALMHSKGLAARRNEIDRITNSIAIFLRGRLERGR